MSECDVCALKLYTRPYNNDDQEASSSLYNTLLCMKIEEQRNQSWDLLLGLFRRVGGCWLDGGMAALKMTYGGYKVLQKIVLMIGAF